MNMLFLWQIIYHVLQPGYKTELICSEDILEYIKNCFISHLNITTVYLLNHYSFKLAQSKVKINCEI